jgi:lysophospholipase L1-like esterase
MDLTNLAVNGSTIISLVARGDYSAIPEDCKYATIMIGLNDTTNPSEQIGDIDTTDTTTWLGCWNTIMSWLRTNRPHLHFGVLIVSAYMSEELRTATRNICQKYGFPYLDMYNDPEVPAFMNKAGMNQAVADALYTVNKQSSTNGHPTLDCQKFMSTFIEDFIRRI